MVREGPAGMRLAWHTALGIRATMIMPGFIDTERRYAQWYPESRQVPPSAPEPDAWVAPRRLPTPACSSPPTLSAYVTGDTIRVMGGRVIG